MEVIILVNILRLLIGIANLYLFIMFAAAALSIMSLVGLFNITDETSFLSRLYYTLRNFISPLTNFISRFVPQLGMIDLSFIVLLLCLWIVKDLSYYFILKLQVDSFML